MNIYTLTTLTALPLLAISCSNQSGGGDYDVANPYSAPAYTDETGTPQLPTNISLAAPDAYPAPSDVNLAYEQPAIYQETTPITPSIPRPANLAISSGRESVHTVVRGDTLWGLSKQYKVPVESIKQANSMTRDTVVLGAKLRIPSR